jgi:hypothetical protein
MLLHFLQAHFVVVVAKSMDHVPAIHLIMGRVSPFIHLASVFFPGVAIRQPFLR